MTEAAARRRARLALAASCVAIAGVLALGPSPAIALSPDSTAWWTRTQPETQGLPLTPPATAPPPPGIPNAGMYVSGSADQQSAISAMRFTVPDFGVYRLELVPADTYPVEDGFTIVAACEIEEPRSWEAEENRPFERAPSFICDDGSPLSTIEDGKMVWEIPATPFEGLFEGEIEFALVPATETPITVAFEAANSDTLTQLQPQSPTDPSTTTTAPAAPTTSTTVAAPAPSLSPQVTSSFGGGAVISPPATDTTTTTLAAPQPVSDEVALPALPEIADGGWSAARTLAVLALLALAGWLALTSRPAASAGGLSDLATRLGLQLPEDAPRGIGRFARQRDSMPTPMG